MRISENRLFPYPLLREGNGNFNSAEFKVRAEFRNNEIEYEFNLEVILKEKNLIKLLKNGEVAILCHLECQKTKSRFIEELRIGTNKFKVRASSIDGRLEIVTLVVAKKDIIDYYSDNFDSDYNKNSFFILKGSILAVADMPAVFVENKKENYSQLPTIFDISYTNEYKMMKLLLNEDRIKILLPVEDYKIWNSQKNGLHSRNIMNALIVFPALVGVLNELSNKEAIDLFGNQRWFAIIHKKLTKLGYNLENGDLDNERIFDIAQELLEELFSEAMNSLRYLEESAE